MKNVSCLFEKDEKGTVEKKRVFRPEKEKKVTTTEVRSALMQFIKWCGSLL